MKLDWLRWKKFVSPITNGNTVLNQDFKEFIRLLNENEVRYLVVGGYAVAIHGHPRYTKDIDIWIEPNAQNIVRLLHALDSFGFGSLGLTMDDFLEKDQVVQLSYPPARINLLTTLEGVVFNACYEVKLTAPVDGIPVYVIDLTNLKKNKKATGRTQDLADLENLQ